MGKRGREGWREKEGIEGGVGVNIEGKCIN